MRKFALLAILAACTCTAYGADFTGTFKGDVQTSSGAVENKLVLKVDGDKVTGTLTNQFGELQVKDGHIVDNDDVFFYVIVKDEGNDFRMVYRGHIYVDEIQFKIEAGERELDLITKRVS